MRAIDWLLVLVGLVRSGLSDEEFCRFREFRCQSGTICLLSEKLCDGVEDCPNTGEDEKGTDQWDCTRVTLGTSAECGDQRKFFKCRFGGCINRSEVCDGVPNCWGGSDEASDLCGGTQRKNSVVPPKYSQVISTTSTPGPIRTTTTLIPKTISILTLRTTTTSTTTRRPTTTTSPPITTTTTTRTRIPTPSENHTRRPRLSCGPIVLEPGQKVTCLQKETSEIIDCVKKHSPNGTRALITCEPYWFPPITGSRNRERICISGAWTGGSLKFRCELDCGEGGFPPVALVAGGRTSLKGKWPWHGGLYESDPPGSNSYSNICGATLIAQDALLTAGHCVTIPHTNDVKNRRDLLIFLGKFNRSAGKNERETQAIQPRTIVIHPDYNYANLDSDIAIIFLEKEVQITPFVHPVCMPSEDDELYVGSRGMLAGWGSVGDRVYPEALQETELPFVSSLTCRRSHSALKVLVRQTNFCAGHRNGTSACDGDSGGGLIFPHLDDTAKWTIHGIVSGGVPRGSGAGCDPTQYVAFTNVAKFRPWIDGALDKDAQRLHTYDNNNN